MSLDKEKHFRCGVKQKICCWQMLSNKVEKKYLKLKSMPQIIQDVLEAKKVVSKKVETECMYIYKWYASLHMDCHTIIPLCIK